MQGATSFLPRFLAFFGFLACFAGADPAAEAEPVCLDILLTNDDGYETLFINTLFGYLRDQTCHNAVMVAPKEGQSGRGTSTDFFTFGNEEGNPSDGIYYLDSTPNTVVYYALDVVCKSLDFTPDLVVSGPNEGWNIGLGGIPSGTIAGAQAGMARGYPSIAVSASLFEGSNPLAAQRVTELTAKFIETKLIQPDGSLLIGPGQGFNVNIPNVFDVLSDPPGLAAASLDDYEYKLTKIGLATPIGAPRYYTDLSQSPLAVQFAAQQEVPAEALAGLSGLSAEIFYFADGLYPLDADPLSEGNAIGQVSTEQLVPLPTFVVTASPIEFTLEVEPSAAIAAAFAPPRRPKSSKVKKSTKNSKNTKA